MLEALLSEEGKKFIRKENHNRDIRIPTHGQAILQKK